MIIVYVCVVGQDDDVIQRSIGAWGKWQFWICIAIFLVKFPVAWHQLSIVIEAPSANFTCSDPLLDKCSRNCTQHTFDRSIFTETIITQWDLVCDKSYLSNMAQTVTMFGILVGNIFFGYWSDRSGRRLPMIVAVIIQAVSGTLCAFVPWFAGFLLLRFIVAVATGGTMVTSFVLIMELIGSKWRTTVATVYQIPFNLGHLLLAALGYLIRDWRYFQLAISLPSIVLISYYWILPESPRWLITIGRKEEAAKTLEKAARRNHLPWEQISQFINNEKRSHDNQQVKGGFIDLVRTPTMRTRTLTIFFNWIVCGLCFFGVAQYIGHIAHNSIFLNVALSALVQIPGTLLSILLLEKLGRKFTLIGANMLAGIPMLLIPLVDNISPSVFATISMFGLSISFPTVYIYSGELFPTIVRNVGVGGSSMCARIGSIIAPHISTLGGGGGMLSPLIFGSIPVIGAALCVFLPETLNCQLVDTIEEAEKLGRADVADVVNEKSGVEIDKNRNVNNTSL